MNLKEFQQKCDIYLESYIEEKIQSVTWYFPDSTTLELVTYLRKFMQKGKRFRPYMVYIGGHLYGDKTLEEVLSLWVIHELVHIFALIHDDICDLWDMRHHIPTYHKHIEKKHQNQHLGISQAMLVWDLVYTRALHQASVIWVDHPLVQQTVYEMLNEVICGQMLDVQFSHEKEKRSDKEIAHKDNLKSGQYSIAKPLLVGAIFWWANHEQQEIIKEIGVNMGIAFQMRDDLLDRLPNNEWKDMMSDIQEGNQTSILSELVTLVDNPKKLWELRGKTLSESDKQYLVDLFKTHNTQEHTLTKIQEKLSKAQWLVPWLHATEKGELLLESMIVTLSSV